MATIVPKSANGVFLRLESGASTELARKLIESSGLAAGSFSVQKISVRGLFYVKPKHRLSLSRSWQIARNLHEHESTYYAEVDVIQPGIEPPTPPASGFRRSSSSDTHKSGSDEPEWSLTNANVKAAWSLKAKGQAYGGGIRIGHPDTGYRRHPEIDDALRLQTKLGYDFEDGKSDPKDPLKRPHFGHGTATASVIMSAVGSPDEQTAFVSGTAPKSNLVPFRVSKSVVHLSFGNVVMAIYASIENHCHIISMSLGGPFGSRALHETVTDAQNAGLIVMAAAGNKYKRVVYPAKIDSVIAVAASNCDDQPWKDTARGTAVDISAPGESVWRARTSRGGQYDVARSSGTSYAVATLAGIAALWLTRHGRSNLLQRYGKSKLSSVFQQLVRHEGFRSIEGWDTNNFGPGIVDAKRLLMAALPRVAPVRRFAGVSAAWSDLNTLEEFADYFPEVPPGRVADVLQKSLGVSSEQLFESLREYGDELRFHCATNEAFRNSLASLASPKRPTVRGFRGARVLKNTQLTAQASAALLDRLNTR